MHSTSWGGIAFEEEFLHMYFTNLHFHKSIFDRKLRFNQGPYLPSLLNSRAVASGGALSPTVFVQTVNPISTRGADYTHPLTLLGQQKKM